jgi:hypothetical protein
MRLLKETQSQIRITKDKHRTQPQLKLNKPRKPLKIVDVLSFLRIQSKTDSSKFPSDQVQTKHSRLIRTKKHLRKVYLIPDLAKNYQNHTKAHHINGDRQKGEQSTLH